jgi:hypothetical protein
MTNTGSKMPYIRLAERETFDEAIALLQAKLLCVPEETRKGACNYVVSRIVAGVFPRGISNIVGALKDAAAEAERRLMAPREDMAILKNGDLPEYEHV